MKKTLLFLCTCLPTLCLAQSAAITIDGRFNDWLPALSSFVDPPENVNGIDILDMQVTNDADHLFIKLRLDTEIDLADTDVPQNMFLYLDTDNDPNTGFADQAGYGTELGVDLSARTAFFNVTPSSQVGLEDFGYRHGPTVTSMEFEIAIARNAVPDGITPLFSGGQIKILFRELDGGDEMPNVGQTFTYTFDNTPVSFSPIDLEKQDPGHVRIVAYNVENNGLNNASQLDNIENIITVLDPDIIGFSECSGTTTNTVKNLLDNWIPLGAGSGWYVSKDDYDLITASRWPITSTWPSLSRQYPVVIDLPASYGTDLLFTSAHLNCCTNDAARQAQVDEYAAFLLDAPTPGGLIYLPQNTPMVYAGDLNLVGSSQQLKTLLTGNIQDVTTWGPGGALDWDGSDLQDVICRQTDEPMAYTWRNDNSSFPPGRLDFMICTDAVMTAELSYALRTEGMSAQRLAQYGLNAYDSGDASDHYPVVTDFSIGVPIAILSVAARVFLEGPFDGVSMDDQLRSSGLIPIQEPYTTLGYSHTVGGGEVTTSLVLSNTGIDAIVDWVLLELRDQNDNSVVVASRSALLQRDGDIVDVDGTSAVEFSIVADNYFLAIRHRNHLGAMTQGPIPMSNGVNTVDLSVPSTLTYGTEARKPDSGAMVLWAGDVNWSGEIKYTGSGNDRDPILQAIGGSVPTNTITGYRQEDVNLNGEVKYTGSENDRDPILVNIGGSIPTAARAEQLP